jgi:protein TonB
VRVKVAFQFALILCCALMAMAQAQDPGPVTANGVQLLHVQPIYPPLARQARIQGEVRLSVLVDRNGGVKDVSVIQGHPMLAPAAVNAVKQWQFEPLLLNGNPVEVKTQIRVVFRLER